jgi:hypothetical protein
MYLTSICSVKNTRKKMCMAEKETHLEKKYLLVVFLQEGPQKDPAETAFNLPQTKLTGVAHTRFSRRAIDADAPFNALCC